MKSDFVMITYHFKSNEDVHIIPISDVHLGAAEHMKKEWVKFCDSIISHPNTYLILGGDLVNNAVKSSVSNVYDETLRPRDQKRQMIEVLMPIKDRILCAVSGNHEKRSSKDVDNDIMYDIMTKLDLEDLYRENTAYMKLKVGTGNTHDKPPVYTLAVTHGAGGGALSGGVINRNERYAYAVDGLDILVVGHSHKPMISAPSKIVIDTRNEKVYTRPFRVVVSSSWLDYGGYAASKMLMPGSHVVQEIHLGYKSRDIKVTM